MRIARRFMEFCAPSEYGYNAMLAAAQARFARDNSIDMVEVMEHGGWYLAFNRDLDIVGTANDMGQLSSAARQWCRQFDDAIYVGSCRRSDDGQHVEHYTEAYAPGAFVDSLDMGALV